MSGRDKAAEKRNADIAQSQYDMMKQQTAAYNQRLTQADAYRQPAVDWAKGVVSDPVKNMAAAQGGLFSVDQGLKAGIQSIMDSVPEGAGRDYALANIRGTAAVQRQQQAYDSFMQALNMLNGFGQADTQTAFNQLGAGMRSGEAGVSTNQALMQAAAQRQAAMFGLIGQLGGIAGNIATGGLFGGASKAVGKAVGK